MKKYILILFGFFLFFVVYDAQAQVTTESGNLCNNGIDDDGDGLTDCADPGCARAFNCQPETNCGDGLDNDGDGKIDCADGDCGGSVLCPLETDCGNGIDDDNDGFFDYYDGDCLADPNNPNTYIVVKPDCEKQPVGNVFDIEVAWQSANKTSAAYGMPMVADIDKDTIPEVITVNGQDGNIFVLDGRNGNIEKSRNIKNGTTLLYAYPTIGDVDGDGYGEIFIVDISGKIRALKYDLSDYWTGIQTSNYTAFGRTMGLADFDQDGTVELYQVNEIRKATDGSVIIKGSHNTGPVYPSGANNWETRLNAVSVAVDILPDSYCTDCKGLELVVGHIIYSVDIANKKLTERLNMNAATTKPAGYPAAGYFPKHAGFAGQSYSSTSIVDYNQDGSVDVILSGATGSQNGPTTIFFWDIKNSTVKSFVVSRQGQDIPATIRTNFRDLSGSICDNTNEECTWLRGVGTLNIANIDADADLECTFMSGSSLYALDNNFNLQWANHTSFWESSSGFTGTTVFDFDGDGESEIIYRDEINLYIVDGTTGNPLNGYLNNGTDFCSSQTQGEYPIVADVDGDGETEIILSCGKFQNTFGNPMTATNTTRDEAHIKVYKAAGDNYWVPARSIWNQPAYFNVNINDNMSVPRYQQPHYKNFSQICKDSGIPSFSLNKFLNQSPKINFCGQLVFPSPKLDFQDDSVKIYPPVCPDQTFQVRLYIENNGDAAVNQAIPISFYSAHPRGSYSNAVPNPYLETVSIAVTGGLQKGQVLDTTILVNGLRGAFTLYASLNDIGPFDENGNALANQDFYPLNYINGPIRECDTLSTIVSKAVTPWPFPIKAVVISDNNKCAPTVNGQPVPDNGLIEVYKEDGTRFPVSEYKFLWTDVATGQTIAPANQDYAAALPAGTYRVEVVYDNGTYTCPGMADTVTVKLLNEFPVDEKAEIKLIQAVSSCKPGTADGSAYVTINGVAISDADYLVRWEDEEKPGDTLAIGASIVGMSQLNYKAFITNRLTGCQTSTTYDMTLETPEFDASDIQVTQQPINCINPNGQLNIKPKVGTPSQYGYMLIQLSPTQRTITTSSNGTFTSLEAGIYDAFMYYPGNECGKYSGGVRIELKPKKSFATPTVTVVKPQTACSAPYTGQLSATITNITDYSFQWYRLNADLTKLVVASTAVTPDTLSTNLTNQYFVNILNTTTGCDTTVAITLTESITIPVANYTITNHQTTCLPNGSISVTASPTPAVYEYTLKLGSTVIGINETGIFNNLAAGPYMVTAKNKATRCISVPTGPIVIQNNIPAFGPVNFIPTAQTNCDDSAPNGKLSVNIKGSTTGYTYKWFEGIDTSTVVMPQPLPAYQLVNIKAGDYRVYIKNPTTGCDTIATYTLADSSDYYKEGLSVNFIQHLTYCSPNPDNGALGAVLTPSVSGPAPDPSQYIFYWYKGTKNDVRNGIAPIPGENASTIDSLLNGTYTVRAVRMDGCLALDTVETQVLDLRNYPKPDINIQIVEQSSCDSNNSNGKLEANVGGSTANFIFDWYRNVGGIREAVALNTNRAENLPEGNYILEVTSLITACKTDTTVTLTDNIAVGSEIELILSPSDVTTCSPNNGSITVTDVVVKGVSTNGASAYLYDWYKITKPGVDSVLVASGTGPVLSGIDQGTYSVIATNDFTSCSSISYTTTVGRDPALDLVFGFNDSDQTDCFPPNGALEVTGLPGNIVNDYTYQWYLGADTSFPLQGATSYAIGGLRAEEYTVAVTSNATGCTTVRTFTLQAGANLLPVPEPNTDIAPATSCSTPDGAIRAQIDPGVLATGGYAGYDQDVDFYYYWFKDAVKYKSPLIDPATPDSPDNYDPLFVPDPTNNRDTITALEAGKYILVIVDVKNLPAAYGCRSTRIEYTVPEDAKKPGVVSAQVTPNTMCGATGNGQIQVEVSKKAGDVTADAGFSFSWFNSSIPGTAGSGAFNESIGADPYISTYNNLVGGEYSVRITDNTTGCDTVLVFSGQKKLLNSQIPPAIWTWNVQPQTDCGPNLGSIEITGLSNNYALDDHDFYWYAAQGDYDPSDPTLNALKVGNTGTPGDRLLNNLMAGTYWVAARSKITNCLSLLKGITVNDISKNPVIILSSKMNNTLCGATGNGLLLISINEQDGSVSPTGYTITWTDQNGNPVVSFDDQAASPVTSRIENLMPGTYRVSVTNNTTSCPVTGQWIISDTPVKPKFIAGGHTWNVPVTCADDASITINSIAFDGNTINLPDANFTFEWRYGTNDAAGATAFNDLVTNAGVTVSAGQNVVNNLPEGTYYAWVNHTLGCTSERAIQIVITKQAVLPLINERRVTDFISCSGVNEGAIEVFANEIDGVVPAGGYTFTWTYADGTALPGTEVISNTATESTMSNVIAGDYKVVVFNNNRQCRDSAYYTIREKILLPMLVVSKLQDQTFCWGNGEAEVSQVTFNGTTRTLSDFDFEWYEGSISNPFVASTYGLSQDALNADSLAVGTYFVKAIDRTTGCETFPALVTIADNAEPLIVVPTEIPKPIVACEPSQVAEGEISIEVMNSSNVTTRWYRGTTNTNEANRLSVFDNLLEANNLIPGDYTVYVEDNFTKCFAVRTYQIEGIAVPLVVSLNATAYTSCIRPDGMIVASVNVTGRPYQYTWYTGTDTNATPIQASQSNMLGNRTNGEYTVVVQDLTDNTCAAATASKLVEDRRGKDLVIQIVQDFPVTNCDAKNPNGQLTAVITGDISRYNFFWYKGNDVSQKPMAQGATVGNLAPQAYTVVARDKITGCLSGKFTQQVEAKQVMDNMPPPVAKVLSHMTRCKNPNGSAIAVLDSTQIDPNADYSYVWTDETDKEVFASTRTNIATGLKAGRYQVTVTQAITGCYSQTAEVTILEEVILPDFEIVTTPSTCLGATGTLMLRLTEPIQIVDIQWTTPVGFASGFYLINQPAGEYEVSITDDNGCVITKKAKVGTSLEVFNGVSPNGDNKNDKLVISCIDQFEKNTVRIYNRAGALVFESKMYDNETTYFDGHGNRGLYIGGQKLPDGTYYYIIDKFDGKEPLSGYLELLR